MSQNRKVVIAIDGPAGAGKSTVAKELAQKLGFGYIDTGAMYRALTWKALRKRISSLDEKALASLAKKSYIVFAENKERQGRYRVMINNVDVSRAIRNLPVTNNVSAVSSLPAVRQAMVRRQRNMVEKKKKGVVVEGRDIGTVVFPHANVKIYLTATPHERAIRRQKDFEKAGRKVSVAALEREIIRRDRMDSSRRNSPLAKASDAHLIDTTGRKVKEVVEEILKLVV